MSVPKIPYPPSPTEVPDGLTDYADSYTKQQNLLLAGLFVFLIFYIAMIILFAMLGVWCFLTFAKWPALKVAGMILCGTFFLYLVKGFFKRPAYDKEMHIEITEEEQPVLFGFIHQLCEELGAPEPNEVFVSPDVNAAVMPRTSLVNLFVEPKKDLLIGLGLVNSVNLSEFKAVLAHEFGHFSQSAMASSYTYVASRIIGDLVDGEDWFDRVIKWCKRQDNIVALFGHAVGACLWVGRKILEWLYKAITLQRLAVSREREFHADLVAVSAAGSNAVAHCLLRTEFGHQCFMQAIDDLATALDHKLYSNDLYMHQDRAAAIVRRKKKEPELGLPPVVKDKMDGKNLQVFDPEEEEMTDDIPPMWRTHPSNSDREANAKEQFVPAVADHRSPWILFNDPPEIKERMSYKFYRMVFRIPKNADLAEAVRVQEYIDNEHADTTYDPKYHGVYDDRPLEPGDLAELNSMVFESPWTEERMEKVYQKLFDGCKEHSEAHADLHKELHSLNANVVGKPSPKIKKLIKEVEGKLDSNWEWFKSFDRRVYLLHVQMAGQVDKNLKQELIERYRFQMEVQRFYQEARKNFNDADAYISAYGAAMRGEIQVPNDFGAEVIAALRTAWKSLKTIVKDAREINLPAMKNFEEGERLADFILEGKMVPEPPLSELKGVWVQKLMTQLQGVKNRCFRLHFKSLGGILAMQEKIAASWLASRAPVTAEIVEVEGVVAAEVVTAEVVEAEVIPAEVVVESFIDAVPVADVSPAPVVFAAPIPSRDTTGAPIAAFVAMQSTAPIQPVATVHSAPPAKEPEPLPIEAEIVAEVVEELPREPEVVFSLDPEPGPSAKEPERPVPQKVEHQEVFSLDSDAGPEPVSTTTAATGDVFTFDADEIAAQKKPTVVAVVPAAMSPPPAEPVERPTFGSGSSASMPALSDSKVTNGKAKRYRPTRPAVKITLVLPGEKSPFGK